MKIQREILQKFLPPSSQEGQGSDMIEDSLASVAVPGKLNKQDTGNFGQPKGQDEVDREYELCASQIKASFN